jgi:DNA-binding transcriptional ArsR family regulator
MSAIDAVEGVPYDGMHREWFSFTSQGWRPLVSDDSLQSDKCAELLKALGEPLRLRIIDALRDGPKNVSELAGQLESEVVTVSHHLGILRHAGLVERQRQGRFIIYRLASIAFEPSRGSRGSEHINLGCCRLEIPKPSR